MSKKTYVCPSNLLRTEFTIEHGRPVPIGGRSKAAALPCIVIAMLFSPSAELRLFRISFFTLWDNSLSLRLLKQENVLR